ncbi:MAG: MerR family transcriptional regulator [Candidatus Dormiibacterota bacterium]|jgi:DNA-binding transcriptional MerR regulator
MPELLDIGEVAARTGMPASTLRYYERGGLVASAGRRGLRRQYRPEVIQTLAVVALCRQAGFNLGEIQELLATGGQPPVRALAAQKRDQLRDHARQLTLLADLIDHFVGCPNANAFECEYFQDALRRALPVEMGPRGRSARQQTPALAARVQGLRSSSPPRRS